MPLDTIIETLWLTVVIACVSPFWGQLISLRCARLQAQVEGDARQN